MAQILRFSSYSVLNDIDLKIRELMNRCKLHESFEDIYNTIEQLQTICIFLRDILRNTFHPMKIQDIKIRNILVDLLSKISALPLERQFVIYMLIQSRIDFVWSFVTPIKVDNGLLFAEQYN